MVLDWTLILVAVIGAGPALLAYWKAQKTSKSIELAGSEITVKNWNTLIKNLYTEIERQDQQLITERARAQKREKELLDKISNLEQSHEREKRELLKQIEDLKVQLSILEKKITATLDVDKRVK